MTDSRKKNPLILIVDDAPKNIQILGMILGKSYRIVVAMNGAAALKQVEKVLPDLILLDVMMPDMDGFETCDRLKSSPGTKDIPVIFLTARTETDDIAKGFELGASDYLSKPFNANELLVKVRTHLGLKFVKEETERLSNERNELLHILRHDLAGSFNRIISLLKQSENNAQDSFFGEIKDSLMTTARNGLDIIASAGKTDTGES